MLNLESRMEILGITVFQDADDPKRFYHLPGPPKLTWEGGTPLFDLYTYRKGGEAGSTLSGGFLNMTVDVGIGSLKSRIEERLRDQFGDDVTLAPVPFTKGSARVIALGEDSRELQHRNAAAAGGEPVLARGPRFIENILGSGTPSLDGDYRSIFSFSLNEDGAAFFLQALNGSVDARPVGVVYELEYVGLLPAYDLEITIDFKMTYEYLRTRFTLGTLFYKMDIDDILEELQRNEAITVRETARTLELSSPEAMRERQERIDALVKELATGALFRPTLVPGEPKVRGDVMTAADPTEVFRGTDSGPLGRQSEGQQGAGGPGGTGDSQGGGSRSTRPAAASRGLNQGPSAAVAAGLSESVSTRASAAEARAAAESESGDASGNQEPAGGGAASGGGNGNGSGAGDGAQGDGSQSGGSQDGGSQSGGSQDGGSQGGGSRSGDTQSGGSRSGGSQGGSSQGGGSRDGDSQDGGQSGGGETPTAAEVWNFLGRPQAAFVYKELTQEEQRTVTYRLNQVTAQKQTIAPQSFIQFLSAPQELNQRVHAVDLNHPFFQRLNINVNAADVDFEAEGIAQMTVQLRYGTRPDGTGPKDTAEVILRSSGDSRDFTFFVDGDGTLAYEYKLIVDYRSRFGIGVQDARVEGPWTRTEARSLSVRPSWLGRTERVQIQLAPNIPPDVAEAHVRVRYTHEEEGIEDSAIVRLSPQQPSETVHLRMHPGMQQFTVQATLFYTDGASEELPLVTLPDPSSGVADDVVVISAPSASRFTADVIMLDPLEELRTVLVDTQVRQEERLVDARTLELDAPGRREVISVRLPSRDTPVEFRYRERRLYRDGGFEEDEWQEAASTSLVVGAPAGGTLTVTINYIGPPPSALGLAAILLDLEYTDPEGDPRFSQAGSLLITDDRDSHTQEWKFRLADRQARAYRWQMTLLHDDGSQSVTEPTEETRDRLILRVPQL